jgi:hypothetical protein
MKSLLTKMQLLLCSLAILSTLAGTASADAVSEMNRVANQSSGANVPARGAPQTTRILAMTHIAIHDAVNAIDPRYESYAFFGPADPSASPVAAIASAAFNVLRFENPTTVATLTMEYNALLATVPDGPAKTAGIAVGEASAAAIRAARANDGSAAPCPAYVPGTGPGDWRPTPPANLPFANPCWGSVTPFALKAGDRFRPPERPYFRLTSPLYTRDYIEVKEYGGATSTSRTTDQSDAAKFWYPSVMFTFGRMANLVGIAKGGLDLWESARMYALLGTAQADAAIVVWDSKLEYPLWRPVTAIREADTDDNPQTEPDATWTSYMVTPPYPDYSSGHSGQDGASSEVLIRFFDTDTIDVTLTTTLSPNPPVTRSFKSFSGAAVDGAESRIWGGLHFRQACVDGLQQGRAVGRQVFNHFFRPLDAKK